MRFYYGATQGLLVPQGTGSNRLEEWTGKTISVTIGGECFSGCIIWIACIGSGIQTYTVNLIVGYHLYTRTVK